MPNHQLLGSPVSYYTGKARAYLNYKQIPYEEILTSTDVFKNRLVPRVGFPIIPVVITKDDTTLQDTTEIIDYFEEKYPQPSIYPSTPLQKLVALLLEVYGDEWLVIPAMHYRWNYPENIEFAKREFGATAAPDAEREVQYKIGSERSEKFSGMVPRLGVTKENSSSIEASYLQLLHDLDTHFKEYPFLLGTRPSIGDYGLIGPLYAHLYRDPASGRIMDERAPNVVQWIHRVHTPTEHGGEFLPDDQIPETLLPILARMFKEHLPVLLNTIDAVAKWADENPGNQKIPRGIGMHDFCVEGVTAERYIAPANLWMWQRPVDFYKTLQPQDQEKVAELFAGYPEAIAALETPIKPRIVRENFRFILEMDSVL
ncbi:glutathione S-transferase [Aurantivibrio plasticivorans]